MGLFTPKISKSEMEHVKKLLARSTDCAALSNTTVKADVFFEKYDELEKSLEELIKYEKYKIFKGTSPSANFENVRQNRKNDLNAFIQRSYSMARKKAENAHNIEKRDSIFKEYFNEMEKYESRIDDFNLQVLSDLKRLSLEE